MRRDLTPSFQVSRPTTSSQLQSNWLIIHEDLIKNSHPGEIIPVSNHELEQVSVLKTPNQAFIVAKIPETNLLKIEINGKLSIALDDVQDPGNFGTILRIAVWFGIETIICSKHTVDAYNPKVIQSSMGAIWKTNIFYTDLEEFFRRIKIPVFASILNGENIYKEKLSHEGIIILGNESKGISNKLLQYSTHNITIPPFFRNGNKEIDSLNIAVSAAIICSEFRRRNNL